MPRAADIAAKTLASAQAIVGTLCAQSFEFFQEHCAWQYLKPDLELAIRMFGEEPPKRAKREELVAALRPCWEKVNYHLLPASEPQPARPPGYQHPALPSYRPLLPVRAQGYGAIDLGTRIHDCKCYGMSGGCWGETAWYEVRHMLTPGGRCLEARCMGHRGMRYQPSTLPEDRQL